MDEPVQHAVVASEAQVLLGLAESLVSAHGSPRQPAFQDAADAEVSSLPAGLAAALAAFRSGGRCALKLDGLLVDPERCGPTPASRRSAAGGATAQVEEAQLALVAAALGESFAWRTIQEGALVQDLMPVRSESDAQSGHGSVELDWHSEDGFHPERCRYLVLLGIRNPDAVPTTVGSIADVTLSTAEREVLEECRFLIRPDPEHLRQLAETAPDSEALREARRMDESPEPVALLFGDPEIPYLRIDAPYTEAVPGDDEAAAVLGRLVDRLGAVQQDVVIGQGELVVVDNYRAVHGRRAFTPRYDGTDRWLKRMSVAERATGASRPPRRVR